MRRFRSSCRVAWLARASRRPHIRAARQSPSIGWWSTTPAAAPRMCDVVFEGPDMADMRNMARYGEI